MRRVLLVALAIGLIAGIAVAVAVPRERAPGKRELRKAGPRAVPRVGPVGLPLNPLPGSEREELRTADPDGGPDWALRTYRAKPILPTGIRPGAAPMAGERPFCAQLGRIVDGRFGWIDGTNTFRPASHSTGDAPTGCADGPPGPPVLRGYTLAADTDRPDGRLTHTVVFGVGGPDTSRVDLRLGARREVPRLSAGGAFIAFASPDVRVRAVRARFEYQGRKPVDAAPELGAGFHESGLPSGIGGAQPRLDRGPARIIARAPDPHGALAWGMGLGPDERRGECVVGPSRIVGDRLGRVDFALGTFEDGDLPKALPCTPKPVEKYGVAVSFLLGGTRTFVDGITDDDPEPGRVARRTLPGASLVFGRARADVDAVTVATPRGVRTLVPEGSARAFITAYDGGFEAGTVEVSARFRDGTSRVIERFQIGGM
jgi:hypothetical protein